MKKTQKFRHGMLFAVTLALSVTGCATLKIGVDVYKGPLLKSDDAQLGAAVGLARNVYLGLKGLEAKAVRTRTRLPLEVVAPRWGRQGRENLAKHMREVAGAYEGDDAGDNGIDELWARYSAMAGADDGRAEARNRLARELFRFGSSCAGLGRLRGVPQAVRLHFPVLGILTADVNELTDGIGLEEAGRWIMFLADDAVSDDPQTPIARMMESVTTGFTASIIAAVPFRLMPAVDEGLENAHWSEINEISVFGMGNTEYVIVKDEIGNWHIKSLQADPSEIVNAVFDGAEAVVGVLAAYYGVDASRDAIGKDGVPAVSETFVKRRVAAAQADSKRRSIQSANLGFQASLAVALQQKTDDVARKLFESAVKGYVGQIGALGANPKNNDQSDGS